MLCAESCWYSEKELVLICKQEKVKFCLVEAEAANAVPPRLSVKAGGRVDSSNLIFKLPKVN